MGQASDAAVAIMKRFVVEVQQNGNYALVEELVHPDFVDHSAPPGADATRSGANEILKKLHAAIQDLNIEIIYCISDGSVVATAKVLRGTQVGDFFGKAATNKPVELTIMDFVTVVDGKLKEHRATASKIQDT